MSQTMHWTKKYEHFFFSISTSEGVLKNTLTLKMFQIFNASGLLEIALEAVDPK